MTTLAFVAGLILLVLGASLLVQCASALANRLGVPPLLVGLTIVAFGTSAPELAVSLQSAWSGQADLALGNVVGSNIFNVLFILGLSALIVPLSVDRQIIRQEVPWMIGASLLLLLLALDYRVGRIDGLILFALLIGYSVLLARQALRRREPAPEVAAAARPRSLSLQLLGSVGGLLMLLLGARWLVAAAIQLAQTLGVSEVVIGLTIVAAGTSLPEVATSLVAAVRGERDIAVGNVVGSNLFNILGVAGLSAVLAPDGLLVAPSVAAFDLPAMLFVALACLPIVFSGGRIDRWEGALFFLYYLAYTGYLILYARDHDLLDSYHDVLVSIALPLTALTLLTVAAQDWYRRRSGRD